MSDCGPVGAGSCRHIVRSVAIGPGSSWFSASVDQIVARYLELSLSVAANCASVAFGLPKAARFLKRHAFRK